MSARRSGFLLVLLAAGCFGFLPVTLRSIYATSNFEPIDVAVWRYVLAIPLVLAFIAWQRARAGAASAALPPAGRTVPVGHLLILGVSYAASVVLAFFGLERLPVAVFMLLFYTYPALVALLSLAGGVPLSRAGWLALALTLCGAVLTISDFNAVNGIDPVGIAIGIVHAFSVAIYFLLSGRLLRHAHDNSRNTGWILVGTLLTLLLFVPFFGLKLPQQAGTWAGLLVLAGICTGLPIFAINAGIQRIGPAQAAIVGSLEPVFSMTLAFVLLGEAILPLQIVGTALIIAAVILLQARPGRPAKKPAPEIAPV
ncbi:MAG: DMT family transporter [Anaerolineae bacterium]|nr:DMT family transporter [Anaerolineae bacterium]